MAKKAEKAPKEPRVPVALDPARLSKGAERAFALLTGARLCKQFVSDERIPRGVAYWAEPTGRKVDAEAAEELIRKGRVRALNDSLFGGDAQSFERVA